MTFTEEDIQRAADVSIDCVWSSKALRYMVRQLLREREKSWWSKVSAKLQIDALQKRGEQQ